MVLHFFKARGLTLLELLVALSIGIFLTGAAFHFLLIVNRIYNDIHEKMLDEFELSLVETLLRDRLKQAGFTPCLSITKLMSIDEHDRPLAAYLIEKDKITLHRMGKHQVATVLGKNSLLLDHAFSYKAARAYVLSDCYHAEIVHIQTVEASDSDSYLFLTKPLYFFYHAPVYFGEWLSESFYVSPSKGLVYESGRVDTLSQAVSFMSVELLQDVFFKITLKTTRKNDREIIVRNRML